MTFAGLSRSLIRPVRLGSSTSANDATWEGAGRDAGTVPERSSADLESMRPGKPASRRYPVVSAVPAVSTRSLDRGGQVHALAGRQVSGMSRSATPRRPPQGLPHTVPGAELHDSGRRLRRELPPGRRAGGLRQVDGMPREPQCGLAEQTRSGLIASARHAPERTSTNAQLNRHAAAPDVTSREPASTFGTKCSPVGSPG
jgi:hypothetical protein